MNPPLLNPCLPCRGSRNHRRLVCVYSPHIVFRFPFVFSCVLSIFVILLLVSRLLCKRDDRDGSHPHPRSPQVIFLPLAETLPFSRVCRSSSPSSAVQKSLGNGHWHQVQVCRPEEMVNSDFLQFRGLALFWVLLECSTLLRDVIIGCI